MRGGEGVWRGGGEHGAPGCRYHAGGNACGEAPGWAIVQRVMMTINVANRRGTTWGQHAARAVMVLVCVCVVIASVGCGRKRTYSQATPEDVVKSAVEMVKGNDAGQLPNLVYADSEEMRALMDRVGVLFQHLQELSRAASKRWPEEYAQMQADALKSATEKTPGLLGMMAQAGGGRGARRAGAGQNPDQIRDMFNAVLADPYGWIDRNASRLSAIKTTDDLGAVLVDGEPAIPVIGLPLKKDGDKWYVALPTNMPPISSFWPRTRQQWVILNCFVQVIDNAVVSVTKAVEEGQVGNIKQLTDKLQEKAIFPGMLVLAPYGKEIDVRERADRRVKQFQTRLRAWAEARKEKMGDTGAVSPKVMQAIQVIAPAEIEKLVRANKPSGYDKMSESEFEEVLAAWLRTANLDVRVDGELTGASAEKAVEAWNAARTAAGKPKK